MEDGTPVEQIADILGHQSVESTGVYLKSSLGLLAKCALDPDAPAQREGGVTMSADITLADAIAALVAEKRAVGYKYAAEERVLARFAAFCRGEFPGLGAPSQASVEAWIAAARRRGVKPATLQASGRAGQGAGPLAGPPGRAGLRPARRRAAQTRPLRPAHLHRPGTGGPVRPDRPLPLLLAVPLRHLVMPVLFRTIYACGLRASEARLLRVDDVDINAGVLQIRDAKGGKDRQVPVSAPLRVRLADYHAQVVRALGRDWFFPGQAGQPLTLGNIDKNFRRFLWQARISHGGRGHGPRVHDLTTYLCG